MNFQKIISLYTPKNHDKLSLESISAPLASFVFLGNPFSFVFFSFPFLFSFSFFGYEAVYHQFR